MWIFLNSRLTLCRFLRFLVDFWTIQSVFCESTALLYKLAVTWTIQSVFCESTALLYKLVVTWTIQSVFCESTALT